MLNQTHKALQEMKEFGEKKGLDTSPIDQEIARRQSLNLQENGVGKDRRYAGGYFWSTVQIADLTIPYNHPAVDCQIDNSDVFLINPSLLP